jgi:hypothetical protein
MMATGNPAKLDEEGGDGGLCGADSRLVLGIPDDAAPTGLMPFRAVYYNEVGPTGLGARQGSESDLRREALHADPFGC